MNSKTNKVGFTASSFDLLHGGHTLMLEEAKSVCDYLIVGLQTDPTINRPSKNRPVQTVVERYLQLRACKYVDEIIPYTTEQDLEDILSGMHIDIRILGVEYKDMDFTGRDICKKRGIEIHFNTRDHRFSSSDLRRRVTDEELQKAERQKRS
jgi:glycerol-3-phosphate cytidylyltransferase